MLFRQLLLMEILSVSTTLSLFSNGSNCDRITLEEHWKFIFETSHLLLNSK